jgi:hypothetical protein
MVENLKPAPPNAIVREIAIPNLYFNGFEIQSSLSDMGALLLLDGQPMARLSMSFTTAKTFAENLTNAIAAFEDATKNKVMTMETIRTGFERQGVIKK